MAVSRSRDYELLVNEGRKQEKKYDWVVAVELYEKALTAALKRNNFSKAAKIYERIGFCYHRAAMQAKSLQEFRNHMLQALNAYNEAAGFFEKAEDPEKLAKTCHCKANVAYVSSWLKPNSASRKRLLDECWKLEKEALRFYKRTNDRLSLARTYNELNTCLIDRLNLEWDKQIRQKTFREALSYGDKAIDMLSELGEEYELARAYYTTSIHYCTAAKGLESEKKRKYEQKALSYSKKAVELSEKLGDRFLLGISNIWLGSAIADFVDRPDSAAKHFENALQCGIHTRDNYLIGRASYLLAHLASWKMVAEEDPEKMREESKKCEKYSEDAIHHFTLISYDGEIASSYYWCAENYIFLAKSAETSTRKKRILLKESIEAGRKGLEHARRSGSINATWFILHPLSKSLFLLSTMETDADVKKRLLEESLRYRRENIKALEQAMPYYFWNHGVYRNYLALIQAELAEIERDKEQKMKLLEDAVENAENCINLCLTHGPLSREQYAALGRYHSDFGGILNRLHLITGTHELSGKLVEVFKGAIEVYEKAGLPSRISESYWQLAKAHNKLQNHRKSAESFEEASRSYKAAAKKLPRLKDFFLDYATYMQAWSEIEKARYTHENEEYGQAKEHYEKAASLHESTRLWRYLAPNYSAWAQLEHGEDLSRKEQSQKAIKAFEKAAELLSKTKQSLEAELHKIQSADEKDMVMELSKASGLRREYCLGRITVEEAKILDRQGNHASSSKRYGLAARAFEKVVEATEHETDRKELKPIIYLCRAWQKMTLAEAKASPNVYMEAAQLFEKAKEHSFNEKVKVLALGHSHFCKALEAGAIFEATRDRTFYLTATQHLESAASYYVKAGLKSASEYARATQRLFDAYSYVDDAKKERDVEKKAKYYIMAERVLETSASSYLKAKHLDKSNVVQRLLEEVREERQLAVSLSEVLHAPPIVAATATFSTPGPTHEEAAGLERFEHADVQANLIISFKKINVGEDLGLEIELVNAGKGPASLMKVEEIIPEGFELRQKPDMYRVEDRYIDMRGKRLGPLKAEVVKLVVRPSSKGTFTMRPRVLYIDEKGKYKSHEPDPVTITVKELGIKGWIRGER